MTHHRPALAAATHEVTNQPPPLNDVDLLRADDALGRAVEAFAPEHRPRISAFAKACGSAQTAEHARLANAHPPVLRSFDRFGHRIDEVEFHPSYHALMALGLEAGVAAAAWAADANGHALHAALLYLMAEGEPSVCCPMSMTYAVTPVLAGAPDLAEPWLSGVRSAHYDPETISARRKVGLTMGMAMTEKQGGSDVRANTTIAEPTGENGAGALYRLTGHKWFCSAPMSDGFLTLAQTPEGPTCFLVPRLTPDGAHNAIHIMRLKDKLGDKANASSEIEYHGALAHLIGEPGRGVRTIIDMVHHTRLDCVVAPAAFMRRVTTEALWHASHRRAFQKTLIDQPLMAATLSELAMECEAATSLAMRLAHAFDEAQAGDASAGAFARIAVPIAKFWLNKRVVSVTHEAMEALGGAGYVEESILPRYYRQAPLNGIWEGSGNIMCLDVLRALGRSPHAADALAAEFARVSGADATLDRAVDAEMARLAQGVAEAGARGRVERLALCLQASALLRSGSALAGAFIKARLGDGAGFTFGAADLGGGPAREAADTVLAAV